MSSMPSVYDTRLLRQIRRRLRVDAFTVTRPAATTNAEGDPDPRTTVLSDFGTITNATASEQLLASQRGTVVDKVLRMVLGLDVRAADFVAVTGTGDIFEVVSVDNFRLYRRALMRKAG